MSKWYVVWQGRKPGVYDNWEECKAQVLKQPGARYKSFKDITRAEAVAIYEEGTPEAHSPERAVKREETDNEAGGDSVALIHPDGIAVDASTRNNPGPMEYRGVTVESKDVVFNSQLYPVGTNNIGEFLAIVHAMAWMKQVGYFTPIYSDSQIAIGWVERKMCKTKLPRNAQTELLFQHIERAVRWLQSNDLSRYQLYKWDTKAWGEIPADYGRK